MPKDNRQDDSTKIFLEISVNLASTEVFLPFELVEQVVLRSDGKKTRYLVPSGRLVFKPTLDLGGSGHSKKSRKVPGKIECLMENGKWFIVNQTYSHLYARVSENSVLLFSNLKFLTVKESKIGEAASQSYISSQGMTHPYLTSAPNIICIPPGHTGCPHLTPAGGRELFEDAIRVNEDYLASYARTPKNHSDNVAAHKASIVAAARGNLAQTVVVNLSGMDSFLVLQAMIEAKIASKSTCKIIAHHVDISEWGERSF